jgi:hypothetical protein
VIVCSGLFAYTGIQTVQTGGTKASSYMDYPIAVSSYNV